MLHCTYNVDVLTPEERMPKCQNFKSSCLLYHTGKCIRRFAGIYAYRRYFIDRMC